MGWRDLVFALVALPVMAAVKWSLRPRIRFSWVFVIYKMTVILSTWALFIVAVGGSAEMLSGLVPTLVLAIAAIGFSLPHFIRIEEPPDRP